MRKAFGAASNRRPRRPEDQRPLPLPAAYWEDLGYTVERLVASLLIRLSPTTEIEDRCDRLILSRSDGAEPSDEEVRVLVAASKAHIEQRPGGWEGVRFFGGTPDFQRRARAMALAMGIPAHLISLECEDPPRPLAAAPMPQHIRRRLQPPPAPDPERRRHAAGRAGRGSGVAAVIRTPPPPAADEVPALETVTCSIRPR